MDKKECIVDKYSTVYSYDVYVVNNPNKDVLNKMFRWEGKDGDFYNPDYEDRVAFTCSNATDVQNNRYCFVVVINSYISDADLVNTCSHEATHVAHDMLSECKIKLSEETEEVYAYLVGYVAECIYTTAKKV